MLHSLPHLRPSPLCHTHTHTHTHAHTPALRAPGPASMWDAEAERSAGVGPIEAAYAAGTAAGAASFAASLAATQVATAERERERVCVSVQRHGEKHVGLRASRKEERIEGGEAMLASASSPPTA